MTPMAAPMPLAPQVQQPQTQQNGPLPPLNQQVIPPDQKKKMMMAQMLMNMPNGGGPLGAASGIMGALSMNRAMNPVNSDQGFGSWAPTITQG